MALVTPHHFFLQNGIEVVLYPMNSLRSVSIQVGLLAGSSTEADDARGTLHFLEHMLLNGCKKYPTIDEVHLRAEELALSFNAHVSRTETKFWFYGPEKTCNDSLIFIGEMLANPVFDQKMIDNSKGIILAEHSEYWNKPENKYGNAVDAFIYGEKNVYVKPVLGKAETIAGMTREKLSKTYNKYYQGQNIKISIAGKIDPVKLKKDLENIFGVWKKGKITLAEPKASHIRHTDSTFIYNEPRDHVQFSIVFPIPGYHEVERAEKLMSRRVSYLLGSSRTSLLNSIIREKLGLVYSIGSSVNRWPYTGLFVIHGSAMSKDLASCVTSIDEILSQVLKDGFEKESFHRAIEYLNMQNYLAFTDPRQIASDFLEEIISGDPPTMPEYFERITKAFTLEDVHRLAKEMIVPQKALLSMMGDKKQIEKSGVIEAFEKLRNQ
jgi:predicted Zn-dependent peptidase